MLRAAPTIRHPDPTVELFLNTVPDPASMMAAFSTHPGIEGVKAEAILGLLLAELGLRAPDEIVPLLEQACEAESNVDLHIFFLIAWFNMLMCRGTQYQDTVRIEEQVWALISDDTPAEIVAWANFMRGGDQVWCW